MKMRGRVVTFDFDGTLCVDGSPNEAMLDLLRRHAAGGDRCYIVTSRNREHETYAWIKNNQPDRVQVKRFVRDHGLPVKQCHFTSHEPKGATLRRLGSVLHYDDDPQESRSALENGVECRPPLPPG